MSRPVKVPLFVLSLVALFLGEATAASLRSEGRAWCGTSRDGTRDSLWAHRERRERDGPRVQSARATSFDVGHIAVLLDEGDLALVSNPLDLQRSALRFEPTSDGYSVSRLELPFEPATGTRLSLGDDDSEPVQLDFVFPFHGRSYAQMFVNSDGNVSFGEKDDASTERNMGRLVNGPPRAAPLLADLDPAVRGSVSVLSLRDHVTVTWNAVPQYGQADRNTFQVTLWADGRIDFVYDEAVSADIQEGVVGVAPGEARGGLTAVDFSAATALSGAGCFAESFRAGDDIDVVAVGRKFYATHADDYQQLIVYTSRKLVPSGAFAYELLVNNADAGIGLAAQNFSAEFGSAGRLESFVMMDALTKYPDDLSLRFLGEDSAFSILAHEVGHRWLANALFRDGNRNSQELLGRDQVHWSFFADTDGSFLEGNDIEAQPDGRFRTIGASLRYSAFDQYLMGMRDASEVPSFFFVRNALGAGNADPGRQPQTGVAVSGVRKDVAIGDVVAALGRRNPAGTPWTQPFRQAFIYVAVGGTPDPQALEKLERIRAAWPSFFSRSTDGRGSVDASLN